MKIILAQKKGMCFGVRRALEIAEKALKGKESRISRIARIYTYGPLVHNKEVVGELEKKGISIASSLDDVEKGSTMIIRAHGVSDNEIQLAKKKGINLIDATCPFVSHAKEAAKDMEKEGYRIIILGQKEHPEVKGIAESLDSPIIISGPEDMHEIAKKKLPKKLGIISQTTQSGDSFSKVESELRKMGFDIKVSNTICSATSERQESARETAKKVGLMLVVGDRNSANTRKLAEICSKITGTKHIENASEIKQEWFKGISTVGVTAGASTPDWIVDGVMKKLKEF